MTRGLITAAVLLVLTGIAESHEIHTTSGRVTLRDGHLALAINVDMMTWLTRLDSQKRTLPMEQLAMVDPNAIKGLLKTAKESLVTGLALTIDGQLIRPARIRFPAPSLVFENAKQAMLAKAADPTAHAPRLVITIEARLTSKPKALSLGLPKSLGRAVIDVIQPTSKTIPAGQIGHFRL